MTEFLKKAIEFATHHHKKVGQVRKYSGEPYIVHPASVAKIVSTVNHTDVMIVASWLHDTVEDTEATLDDIFDLFGHDVAELVEMLTDVSKPQDGNRAVRKNIDLLHTAKASNAAKTIKLADLIDNSERILKHDRGFAVVYLKEKAKLMEVLVGGDPILYAQAKEILEHGLRELNING